MTDDPDDGEKGEKNEATRKKFELLRFGEPKVSFCSNCKDCGFMGHCFEGLPEPNVFDLAGMSFADKCGLYKRGIVTYEDVKNSGVKLRKDTKLQLEHHLLDLPPYVDGERVKKFLGEIKFPLSFLDFEGYSEPVPALDGEKPYSQICFQYSLHVMESPNAKPMHFEFLADGTGDPRRAFAESLVKNLPKSGSVAVYNLAYENTQLLALAEMFPEFSEKLIGASSRIVDFMRVFKSRMVYAKEFGAKYSIKVVLKSLFPNDPNLDYGKLRDVHNGCEAPALYLSLKDMTDGEREDARANLLKYCGLDTYALVKVYEWLSARC